MIFVTTAIFVFRLAVLAIANPVPNRITSGMAMPLAKHFSLLDANKSVDLAAVTSHLASVRDKILRGFDNYEKDSGTPHPFTMKGGGSRKRGGIVPLTNHKMESWMVEISIGTPAKTFTVDIDTGSSDLFVFQTGCAGSSCEDRNLWDTDTSKTAEYVSDSFKVEYADGRVASGDIYQDNVTIAGYMADPLIFGAAKVLSSPIDNNPFTADGMLGMAVSSTSKNPTGNLFATLVSQKKVFNPTFSLKLSSSGGELYIGGSNSKLYNGAVSYASVIDPSSGYWKVSVDDIRIGGIKILENVPAIIDTGANFIFGDRSRVATLYSRIGGKRVNGMYKGFGFYYLPCNSFPTLSLGFTFGGRSFEIPPEVFMLGPIEDNSPYCFGSIVAEEDSSDLFWAIGSPFLQLVYTIFDYSTSQVGFADLA